jgi:hypothetical protein
MNIRGRSGYSVRFVMLVLSTLAIGALWSCASDKKEPTSVLSEVHFDPKEMDKKLNALSVDVEIGHFNSVLGAPASSADKIVEQVILKVRRHATPRREVHQVKLREYWYEHPGYYVQAVTNEEGKVGMFTITARTEQYQPQINTAIGETISLGKSTYDVLPGKPRKVAARLDAEPKESGYYEVFMISPENKNWLIFSTNPKGYVENIVTVDDKKEGVFVSRFSLTMDDFPVHETHGNFRSKTTMNTYGMAASWFEALDLSSHGANFGDNMVSIGPQL